MVAPKSDLRIAAKETMEIIARTQYCFRNKNNDIFDIINQIRYLKGVVVNLEMKSYLKLR